MLRIAVIAPLRFPIRRPHAGGLESAVWTEVAALRRRGHDVTLIAVRGSDFVEPGSVFELPALSWPADARPTDKTYPSSYAEVSVPALERALDAVATDPTGFDVISNHCLHALPLRRAPQLGVPMVTTLHTPVDDDFVAAHADAHGAGSTFFSVSSHIRREWFRAGVPSALLANAIDPDAWPLGPGGDSLVWFGRVVPEKSPHLAIEVARRLQRPLVLAGRIGDRGYAEEMVLPLLGGDVSYAGPLGPDALARLVGCSALALSTPSWAEPFGLVAPEALMCGTPAVSFAVGGVPEIAAATVGMELAPAGDVAAMADAARDLLALSAADPGFRARVRESAVTRFSFAARLAALEERFTQLAVERDELTA
jgi:glycosyltransferase involved in cell wall biosynthesis